MPRLWLTNLLRLRHNPYFYTTVASYKDEVVHSVRHLMTLKRGQISVVYQNNEFGKLMLPLAEQAIKDQGGTMVSATVLVSVTSLVGIRYHLLPEASPSPEVT